MLTRWSLFFWEFFKSIPIPDCCQSKSFKPVPLLLWNLNMIEILRLVWYAEYIIYQHWKQTKKQRNFWTSSIFILHYTYKKGERKSTAFADLKFCLNFQCSSMISQYNTRSNCINDTWINKNWLFCACLQLLLHSVIMSSKIIVDMMQEIKFRFQTT